MSLDPQVKTAVLRTPKSPNLLIAPVGYQQLYQDQLNNALRLYFNQLDNVLAELIQAMSGTIDNPTYVAYGGATVDAFGRLRVSQPYTLFDSQNRFAADNQFSDSTVNGASITYDSNASTVLLSADTTSGSKAVRQTYRVFPYQPGKSLEVFATFVMAAAQTNLRQRVGYFNTGNGLFFQVYNTTKSFVLRTNTSGTPSDARTVNQADWNGDKLDGTGASGLILDPTKAQILYMDFEWLGVGSVRCGFVIDGQVIICHTFNNANDLDKVYMSTAILPVRYEIEAVSTMATGATMKQICSTVISEGGFEQISIDHVARRTSVLTTINNAANFIPVVSIRLASTALGAVVLPNRIQFLPTTSQNYEIALLKNPTLTGATWAATVPSDSNVEFDVAATAISNVGTIVQTDYVTSSGSGGVGQTSEPTGYNWDLQLGASLAGVSDIYTLGVRTVTGATTGDGVGSISFYDLTQ
jgi:hypothetical protein